MKVGILGGAGYTGGELIRILLNHEQAEIVFVNSTSQAGKPVAYTHKDLFDETTLKFKSDYDLNAVDVLFVCSGHGKTKQFLDENKIPDKLKIIDLSTDFRNETEGFIYGLPELKRAEIEEARLIANPGCFATAIQLALLPLAYAQLLQSDIHISAITGSTGAGQALSDTTHFSWRESNVSVYKAFTHQHLTEIGQSLGQLQSGFKQDLNFIPYRGNFTRGILANVYTTYQGSLADAQKLYTEFYDSHPFCSIIDQDLDLKMVVNTNKCLIQIQKHGEKLLISSTIDNLLKGASGQAVQNMNLMFGLNETTGLKLKPSGF